MERIKYTTLIDYVLAVLRNVRNSNPNPFPNGYASLVSILDIFSYKMPFGEIQELGKYLETKGWAKVLYPLGDVRIQITTRGLLYIEEKGEPFLREYEAFRQQIIEEKKDQNLLIKIFNDQDDPKENITRLLDALREKIIQKEGPNDLTKDVEVIKIELSKVNPDFRLIEIKLTNLTSISYLSSEIQELKDYLIIS